MASRVSTRGQLQSMEARTVAESRTIFSQVMLPGDANPVGTVHGGTIAKLVDSTGAVAAMRHCRAYAASVAALSVGFGLKNDCPEGIHQWSSASFRGKRTSALSVWLCSDRTADVRYRALL